jgi:hypothetical protein
MRRCFHCYPPHTETRKPAGMDAGVNRITRFLRGKNLKAKNGRDAGFRPRKG